ncbi:pirin family protein [Paraglaciecola aquimarina]|uniref:Pirin family protein n=1 Tax=Paraglaciecola aquimarina TaxID=1235557 RepID=A0ABU3SYE1_9ALTE|nr:pirin family protein [Paraglaciecola aquimarina]MDU0355033.1 pirin family protein [Paraglaciecola aquimarina]
MIEVRKSNARGQVSFDWLDSKHSFSFGSYYDPQHMGFSVLRVINDDTIKPSAGFGTHGHKDMEIITFVTQGTIEHKDSMGNVKQLPKGEFQLMSAGKGITHSEYNASDSEQLTLLQIWIEPESVGSPDYQQKDFGQTQGLTAVITPTGENGTLKIKQNATISHLYLAAGTDQPLIIDNKRKVYIQVVEGELKLNEHILTAGDGIKLSGLTEAQLKNNAPQPLEALVFDLP